jgi:hypothetical protein
MPLMLTLLPSVQDASPTSGVEEAARFESQFFFDFEYLWILVDVDFKLMPSVAAPPLCRAPGVLAFGVKGRGMR